MLYSLASILEALAKLLGSFPLAAYVGTIVLLAAWRPCVALAVLWTAAFARTQNPAMGIAWIAAGISLRAGVSFARGGAVRSFLSVAPSRTDWSRRIAASPWRNGWAAGVLRPWSDHAWAGLRVSLESVGAERPGPMSRVNAARFALAGFAGILVWSMVAWQCVAIAMIFLLRARLVPPGSVDVLGDALDNPDFPRIAPRVVLYVLGIALASTLAGVLPGALCVRGSRFLTIAFQRVTHKEYWPTWVWYMLIAPRIALLALRHRSLLCWLACNPGIPALGGLVGERKSQILAALSASPLLAKTALLSREPCAPPALAQLHSVMGRLCLEYPVILKPDVGERGHAVKIVRSDADASAYLESMRGDCLVQEYHAGPLECGVLWARWPKDHREHAAFPHALKIEGCAGFLYSITDKVFPSLAADGVSTLEELVERHPRFRRQHRVFLSRLADDASRVFPEGTLIDLGKAGNHCQGTLFRDGGHLITPALTRAIDELARNFAGGLDYGRFDIRYEDADALRDGLGFRIIEMNGTSAESTNIYDPERSLAWAMRTLLGQYRLMGALGTERIRAGSVKPTFTALRRVFREARVARCRRGGSTLSD